MKANLPVIKKTLTILVIGVFFLINTSTAFAQIGAYNDCEPNHPVRSICIDGFSCQLENATLNTYTCKPDPFGKTFGKIKAPDALSRFLKTDPTGAGGISMFLSNLIALFYSVAAIVLIFMLLWGAFEWMTSGGEKEKIESARRRIISAIIGIILFAVAFAVIQILGVFTGFRFFENRKIIRDSAGNVTRIECPDGKTVYSPSQPGYSLNISDSSLYPCP